MSPIPGTRADSPPLQLSVATRYAALMPCSVLIVEDDARFREAFVQAVALADDMTLVGSAGDVASGMAALADAPDVLLVDLELPDGDGVELIREAAHRLPECDTMVVTVFGDERNVLRSIEAGATGYLLKDLPAQALVAQIRVLRAGGSPISPIIARQFLTRFSSTTAEQAPTQTNASNRTLLSQQEQNVLSMTAKGYSYDEVANLLKVSPHTVQTYVKRIYRKLQVRSKTEAVYEARRLNLIGE